MVASARPCSQIQSCGVDSIALVAWRLRFICWGYQQMPSTMLFCLLWVLVASPITPTEGRLELGKRETLDFLSKRAELCDGIYEAV